MQYAALRLVRLAQGKKKMSERGKYKRLSSLNLSSRKPGGEAVGKYI